MCVYTHNVYICVYACIHVRCVCMDIHMCVCVQYVIMCMLHVCICGCLCIYVCVCMCQDSQSIVFSKGMALQSPHSCLVTLVK